MLYVYFFFVLPYFSYRKKKTKSITKQDVNTEPNLPLSTESELEHQRSVVVHSSNSDDIKGNAINYNTKQDLPLLSNSKQDHQKIESNNSNDIKGGESLGNNIHFVNLFVN